MDAINHLWVVICACFVFFMQAGFICYEVGFVQSKNVVSVAIENILSFVITVVAFSLWGFGLMFGPTVHGLIGNGYWMLSHLVDTGNPLHYAYAFFQLMFSGAAVTIFSGSMSERTKLSALLLADLAVAGLIYPVYGHWAWGGSYTGMASWLQNLGFVDFAGATVVHATAGWLALAGIIVVGARRGRFDTSGRVNRLGYSNIPFAALGTFILWFSWFGFNGGSLLAFDARIGQILLNTNFAAVTGVLGALVVTRVFLRQYSYLEAIFSGALGGLVAVTAGSNLLSLLGAALTGFIAGAVVVVGAQVLLRAGLDDAVGAVSIHAFGGVTGTLMLALLVSPTQLPQGAIRPQLLVQAVGVMVNFVWAFGLGYLLFRVLDRLIGLRVSAADEKKGLNIVEFGDIYSWASFLSTRDHEKTTRLLNARIRTQNVRLSRQARLLIATQEQERRKLGRDLHDGTGQSLAAAKIQLGMLQSKLAAKHEPALENALVQASGLLDTAIDELRGTLLNLRPVLLQEQGLRRTVEHLAETVEGSTGLRVRTVFPEYLPAWDEATELNIYRIIQEGLANIIKHAGAAEAEIVFAPAENKYVIKISDTGQGFAPDAGEGFGLATMRERAVLLGGEVRIKSKPGLGTTLVLEVPTGNDQNPDRR